MRLWHIDLIPYLPRLQLISQWRELCAIISCLKDNNLNHGLVNKINNYDYNHFYSYSTKVITEMHNRGYKISEKAYKNFFNNLKIIEPEYHLIDDVYLNWHNEIYLRQCLYNLEEKYNCNLIKQEEWDIIYNKFNKFIPLIKEKS